MYRYSHADFEVQFNFYATNDKIGQKTDIPVSTVQ